MPDEIVESNTTSKDRVWQTFFDGAARMGQREKVIVGAKVVCISPEDDVLPFVYSLTKPCSNNVAEYNAVIIRLQIAEDMRVLKYLEVYGDS